ncbi:hypothetical protein CHS0354_037582 [Potamilus streckersoni]|uniref:Uncharacterized protein n=1 Tax=Potamilus streckersoni TaxID=2493646 RepID=A0AAE0SV65_9BIVA|nr:hypothetical protein CHS0354_037582 [Potamilus streckersoni]
METVWLKDVTTTIQTDKRTLGDPGLPAHLTFHLMRGSDALTLNLKRNYEIDPNADIYVVQSTKGGQSTLSRTRHLRQEFLSLDDICTFTEEKQLQLLSMRKTNVNVAQ